MRMANLSSLFLEILTEPLEYILSWMNMKVLTVSCSSPLSVGESVTSSDTVASSGARVVNSACLLLRGMETKGD